MVEPELLGVGQDNVGSEKIPAVETGTVKFIARKQGMDSLDLGALPKLIHINLKEYTRLKYLGQGRLAHLVFAL
jgi:hypothetical protein